MQAFLTLPSWVSNSMHDRNPDKMACSRPRQVPVVDIPLLNKLKRNRSTSTVAASSPELPTKKLRTGVTSHTATRHTASVVTPKVGPPASKASSVAKQSPASSVRPRPVLIPAHIEDPARRLCLQQKIESQLNLEILLKHDELRLIDTELAKCQIALEQLRRCEAIPFPGEPDSPVSRLNISAGSGPALMPPAGLSHPRQPAPWGVVDGPYSRHYAHWLLPDPEFDASPSHLSSHAAGSHFDGRPTRGTLSERRFANKSRTTTTSTVGLQALATNYATPKDKSGPLVIKRPADGQMVKLVCHQCNRENFSSVQGFLNHCRIAHGRNFESHGAAADSCGVPVDNTETIPAPEMSAAANASSAPVPTTSVITSEPAATTPHAGRPLVHPFITSAKSGKDLNVSAQSTPSTSPVAPRHAQPTTASRKQSSFQFPRELAKGQFVPSTQTPRLSALVKKFGLGADFNKIVDQAKEKIDLEQVSPIESDDEADSADAMQVDPPIAPVTTAHPASKPKASMGGVRMPSSRARPTPLRTNLPHNKVASGTGSTATSVGTPEEEQTDFSPHTIETNPGLISDREDEDYEDQSSRTSEEDLWSEHDHHHVQVRQAHHKDDGRDSLRQILGHGDDAHDDVDVSHISSAQSCARAVETPLSATPATPPKRKRGRPSKKDAQSRKR